MVGGIRNLGTVASDSEPAILFDDSDHSSVAEPFVQSRLMK